MGSRIGATKRLKELARAEKQVQKGVKREQRRKDKEERLKTQGEPGQDPDLAGIVPGPQAPIF